MTDFNPTAATSTALPRSLTPSIFLFTIIYGGMVVLAGVLGNKQIALGSLLAVEAGRFSFLILVAISSAVAELHGQSVANKLVLWGFVPLVISIGFTSLVLALPASNQMDPERLAAFEMVLDQSPRLMAAGIIAYGTSQFLNVTIFSKLRSGASGRALGVALGGAIASALSQIVDTVLFVTISFYGVFPIGTLMGGQMIAKVVLSVAIIPFVITGFVALGRNLDSKNAA